MNSLIHNCYRSSKIATIPLAISNVGGVAKNKLLMNSDRVILLTKRAKQIYVQAGLPEQKIEIVPNFVPDLGFGNYSTQNQEWAFLGRFSPEKGIENLIKYWPKDKKLVFFGNGPLEGLISTSQNPGIRLGGSLNRDELSKQLQCSKGLIFSSEWPEGGVPLSYCEALSVGLPVVALAGNSAADDVIDAKNGRVFQAWEEFSKTLDIDQGSLKQMSLNSRNQFEKQYSSQKWLEKTEGMYTSVLDEFKQKQSV